MWSGAAMLFTLLQHRFIAERRSGKNPYNAGRAGGIGVEPGRGRSYIAIQFVQIGSDKAGLRRRLQSRIGMIGQPSFDR